jgi:hypothetical protein
MEEYGRRFGLDLFGVFQAVRVVRVVVVGRRLLS